MDGDPQNLDDVFDVLSVQRRRDALRVISAQASSLTLADLADEVAVRENQARISEISAEEVKRIYLDLYHSHIPKLAEIGVIDYQQEEDLVTPIDNLGHVVSYLHVVDENGSVPDPCTA